MTLALQLVLLKTAVELLNIDRNTDVTIQNTSQIFLSYLPRLRATETSPERAFVLKCYVVSDTENIFQSSNYRIAVH